RKFVQAAGVAGAGLMFMRPELVRGTQANSALGIGIIGCGGRGNHVGGEFVQNTETRVVALADPFDDRLTATRDSFDKMNEAKSLGKIPAANIFKGARAYEKLVGSKDVDIVLVTSPPYFHPEHFAAAVAAGKHVYLEKPVATDVHGCKQVMKTGQQADGKVSVHVGFQKRYADAYRALVERIHGGEIGDVVLGQTFYYTNDLDRQSKPGMSEVEARLRNWVFDKALSGDILVEQNIHIIDVCNWVLKAHPLKAMGAGGRITRKDVGDVWDHFIVTFFYPNDVKVSFNSNQFRNKVYRMQGERFFGTKGVAESHHRGPVKIAMNSSGATGWDAGTEDPLAAAVANKAKAFVAGIRAGKFDNEARQGAETTLTAILGRTAAYTGREQSWDALVKTDAKWDLKLNLDALDNGGAVSMK
ncbi:MAG: Gfo/Idh/MocA family oxidoreductase, partial [Acidobacteriota bacterium]|nr:Gfo/Idh/MocA family oxidoreductase [Acidobacteriota bacterium]